MQQTFVLIHSPLVGPYTWVPVAEELQRRDHGAIVPSLLAALDRDAGFVQAIAACVAGAVDRPASEQAPILVAHSAAGSFLPAIRTALGGPPKGYLFVDARLPLDATNLIDDSSQEFRELLRGMAVAGILPPWSAWFGEEAMREAVPDDQIRARFLSELRPIPFALFEEPVPVFSNWPDAPCGYIRLSETYGPLARRARTLGWPVLELAGDHLHMLVDPGQVTEAILEIAARFDSP